MPQVFHLGGGSSNFGLDSHLHRVQLGNGSERVVVQMNANGHIEFSNPVTGNAVSFPFETMYGNIGLEMNGVMSSDSYIGVGSAPSDNDEVINTDDSTSISEAISYPTGMNAADNPSNYPGFTNAMYFNGSDDYLTCDLKSSSNPTAWTYSLWFKRERITLGYWDWFFDNGSNSGLVLSYGGAGENWKLNSYDGATDDAGGSGDYEPSFKDTSSWYHLVYTKYWSGDSRRWSFFVNGKHLTKTGAENSPVKDNFNTARTHYIGCWRDNYGNPNRFLNGYLANIQFIDGHSLDASYFGQYMVDSNGNPTSAWMPKLFDGTSSTGGDELVTGNDYGTNGFLLDFSSLELNNSGEIIQVNDTAPKSDGQSPNNWTAN